MAISGLHVGLVGPLPPPYGGMANQTRRQLARLLRGEGLTVSLVQTNADYRPQWVAGVPVIRAFFRLLPYLLAIWRIAGSCNVLHVMANSGWSWHLFATPAIWILRLRKTPVIVNYRGGEAESFCRDNAICAHDPAKGVEAHCALGFLHAVFSRFGAQAAVVPNIIDVAHFNNPEPHRPLRRHLLVARNLEPIYDNRNGHSRVRRNLSGISGGNPDHRRIRPPG